MNNIYNDEKSWKDNSLLIRDFLLTKEQYEDLAREICYILKKRLNMEKIKFSTISYRVKELDSFLDKFDRKQYQNPLEITDRSGIRIVYLYKGDLKRIKKVIENTLSVIEKVDKTFGQDVDKFGYEAVHYLVKIGNRSYGARYDDIKGLVCEIQVRTVLQDAWAIVNHHLNYKCESSVPNHLLRKMNALSATFELADEHLSELNNDRKAYLNKLNNSSSESLLTQQLNIDSFVKFLQNKFPNLPLTVQQGRTAISYIVEELYRYNYSTLNDIDTALKRTEKARQLFNKEETYGKASVREIFIAAGLLDKNFRQNYILDEDRKLVEKFESYILT